MNKINLQAPIYLPNYHQLDLARTIFLGGSISGAANWQTEATKLLLPHFHIFNPRRDHYEKLDPAVEREQITWEFQHLNLAEIALFYFSHETVAPITLFEYGKQLIKMRYAPFRKTYVCIHPNYARKNDVLIQTQLEQPELVKCIFDDLPTMCAAIIKERV